jgi:hypothetical protein
LACRWTRRRYASGVSLSAARRDAVSGGEALLRELGVRRAALVAVGRCPGPQDLRLDGRRLTAGSHRPLLHDPGLAFGPETRLLRGELGSVLRPGLIASGTHKGATLLHLLGLHGPVELAEVALGQELAGALLLDGAGPQSLPVLARHLRASAMHLLRQVLPALELLRVLPGELVARLLRRRDDVRQPPALDGVDHALLVVGLQAADEVALEQVSARGGLADPRPAAASQGPCRRHLLVGDAGRANARSHLAHDVARGGRDVGGEPIADDLACRRASASGDHPVARRTPGTSVRRA